MEPIFTLQYAEYAVANYLKKHIKNISIYIPTSRQEKGVDMAAIYYGKPKNKITTFQVKYSRPYESKKKVKKNGEEILMSYRFWYNRFKVPNNADWILIVGVYPKGIYGLQKLKKAKWDIKILAFTKREMSDMLQNIHYKKNKKSEEKFFDIHIDKNAKNIYQFRGTIKPINRNKYTIDNRIKKIEKSIK